MSRPSLLLFAAFLPDASLPSSSLSAASLACPPLWVQGGCPSSPFYSPTGIFCSNGCPKIMHTVGGGSEKVYCRGQSMESYVCDFGYVFFNDFRVG